MTAEAQQGKLTASASRTTLKALPEGEPEQRYEPLPNSDSGPRLAVITRLALSKAPVACIADQR